VFAERTALLAAAGVAGICATLAGCGNGASTQFAVANPPAATRQATSPRPSPAARVPQLRAGGTAARTTRPPAPAGHAPPARPATLTSGLYTDAPDGTPHYVLGFTAATGSAVRVAVSYLYQDGRIAAAGSYRGTLASGGKLTLTPVRGQTLTGRYDGDRVVLDGCAAALPLITSSAGCRFAYHGHIP